MKQFEYHKLFLRGLEAVQGHHVPKSKNVLISAQFIFV